MREIDITQWTKVGEGGNGAVYTCPREPGVLLKDNNRKILSGTDELKREFELSKAIEELGVPTPKMYELVSVNGSTAILCEEIKGKQSFARLCSEHPEKLDDYASRMAHLALSFHNTSATQTLPSKKQIIREAVEQSQMLNERARKRVLAFVDELEDSPNLVHGDFTFSNLILADDKPYWIDLGNAAHGSPFFDLGHFYLFCNIFGRQKRVQDIAHLTSEQMARFWNIFASSYIDNENIDVFNRQCRRFAALDIIFLGHVQPLTASERFFLGMLAKKMIRQ